MLKSTSINGKRISPEDPPYLVAEISGNHKQSLKEALKLVAAAAKSGANAVKLQTYTPDTITLPFKNKYFKIKGGLWNGKYLHELYKEAMTPWEWTKDLAKCAHDHGITLFSTPFDESSVDFLEDTINPPAYKIASMEINHIPLLRKVGKLKKPVIVSTGMATQDDILEAVQTLKKSGTHDIILLKCISAYPADPKDFNLRTIPELAKKFKTLVGLSDHTLSNQVCMGAVALGACFIEKHFVLDRSNAAVDSAFSLEPKEFTKMTEDLRVLFQALGNSQIGPAKQEAHEMQFRRSIFVSKPVNPGEQLTPDNIKIVRPSEGVQPKYWDMILGKVAKRPLKPGEPLLMGDWL